jgi:5'-nucleotidase/UDP-sugar diphosphatase
VGLLGQMGPDSVEKAPVASPITFEHGDFLQDYVEALKDNDGADMVIVLSHGGVETDGTGDDADLAADVEGIDIIASGHFHTATHDAIMTGPSNTIIFSPGEYGEWVSRIDITYNDDLSRIVDYEFTLIPVDDTVPGDPFIQFIVEQYHAGINAELDPLYLSKPVSSTSFALEKEPLQVTGIGSLCADSLRAVASSLAPINDGNQYHVGIVASGVIRDSIYPGKTGVVTFSDVYNMLPLGISPYDPSIPGYPLMSIYASAADVYKICEVALTFAPSMGSDYYLNFSGIKIDYNPFYAQWLQGVRAVYVYAPADALCLGPLGGYDDPAWLNPSDAAFYHIVVDLYALQMLNGVNSYLIDLGIDPIVPRDAAGIPIDFSILANYRIDKDPSPVSFQELKEWMAPLTFLPGITEGDPPVPVIPSAIYGPSGTALGRVNFVSY